MQNKKFCICIEVYKNYESNDYNILYEVLSTFKNKKLKINNVIFEKNKDIVENPDFERNYWTKMAEGI